MLAGLATARELGLLTIALVGGDGGRIAAAHAADHLLTVASDDPCVIKEMQVTTYHVLWELVHVFFEQPGVLDPGVVHMTAEHRPFPAVTGNRESTNPRETPATAKPPAIVHPGRADTMAFFAIGPPRTDSGGYGGSPPRKTTA